MRRRRRKEAAPEKIASFNIFSVLNSDAGEGGAKRDRDASTLALALSSGHHSQKNRSSLEGAASRGYTYRFAVERGEEFEMMWNAMSIENNFLGCCYHCGQPGHSQNFCPLRRCRRCGQWGHSDKGCAPSRGAQGTKAEGEAEAEHEQSPII